MSARKAKRPKAVKRTMRVARHEAAHAVVAEHLGWPVKRVVIFDAEHGGSENGPPPGVKKLCPFEYALICLAGDAAERRWHRMPRRAMNAEDSENVLSMGYGARAVATLAMHADALVEEQADAIERVAMELRKRDLSGDDVRRLICPVPVKRRKARRKNA